MFKRTMNPRRVGPDSDEETKMDSFEFENITTEQIEGNLFLYLIFNSIAIFVLIVEIIKIKISRPTSKRFLRKVKKNRKDLRNEQVEQ